MKKFKKWLVRHLGTPGAIYAAELEIIGGTNRLVDEGKISRNTQDEITEIVMNALKKVINQSHKEV